MQHHAQKCEALTDDPELERSICTRLSGDREV